MADRFVRFLPKGSTICHYGQVVDQTIIALSGPPWLGIEKTDGSYSLSDVKLLAPVKPSKVVCIGLNYHAHVAASHSAENAPKRPLIFLKPPSSIIGPNDDIVHPEVSERVDYEAELGIVIGATATKVKEENGAEHIFGLTCVNDVTARDLQKIDGQWSRAKGFDTFCPVGPEIVTGVDFADLLVEGVLNDQVMQSGRTSLMIFNIPSLISYVSKVMTLLPGDLISTGTPAGIAPMKPGDKIEVRVESVGNLVNRVV